MRRKIVFATLALLLAFAISPAHPNEPSLLKVWVWFELGGQVAMDEIKQDNRGVIHLRKGEYKSAPSIEQSIQYSIADPKNCVIRQIIPALSTSTLIYLNNFVQDIQVLSVDNGSTEFAILGRDHTHCTKEARGTFCMDQMHFRANNEETFTRMKLALNLIFSKFCTYAVKTKVPSASGEWQTTIQ
jgi:hypothetical protein